MFWISFTLVVFFNICLKSQYFQIWDFDNIPWHVKFSPLFLDIPNFYFLSRKTQDFPCSIFKYKYGRLDYLLLIFFIWLFPVSFFYFKWVKTWLLLYICDDTSWLIFKKNFINFILTFRFLYFYRPPFAHPHHQPRNSPWIHWKFYHSKLL